MMDEIRKAFKREYLGLSSEERMQMNLFADGFTAGAESRQAEIDELKEIILKMRNNRFEPDKIDIFWHKSLKIGR